METRSKTKSKRKAADTVLRQSRGPKVPYSKERLAGLKPWQPGESGNPAGRPVGARSKLSEEFLQNFYEEWQKHGPAALEWVANNDQSTFVRCAAALIPKNLNVETNNVVYHIADHPLTAEEWVAKYCDPAPLITEPDKPVK
jgi:Family of unknown function (DUF5681)